MRTALRALHPQAGDSHFFSPHAKSTPRARARHKKKLVVRLHNRVKVQLHTQVGATPALRLRIINAKLKQAEKRVQSQREQKGSFSLSGIRAAWMQFSFFLLRGAAGTGKNEMS